MRPWIVWDERGEHVVEEIFLRSTAKKMVSLGHARWVKGRRELRLLPQPASADAPKDYRFKKSAGYEIRQLVDL